MALLHQQEAGLLLGQLPVLLLHKQGGLMCSTAGQRQADPLRAGCLCRNRAGHSKRPNLAQPDELMIEIASNIVPPAAAPNTSKVTTRRKAAIATNTMHAATVDKQTKIAAPPSQVGSGTKACQAKQLKPEVPTRRQPSRTAKKRWM